MLTRGCNLVRANDAAMQHPRSSLPVAGLTNDQRNQRDLGSTDDTSSGTGPLVTSRFYLCSGRYISPHPCWSGSERLGPMHSIVIILDGNN